MDFRNLKSLFIGGKAVARLMLDGRLAWKKAEPVPPWPVGEAYIETDGVASYLNLGFVPTGNCSLEVCATYIAQAMSFGVFISAGNGRTSRFTFRYNAQSRSIEVMPNLAVISAYPEPVKGVYRYVDGVASFNGSAVDHPFEASTWPMCLGCLGGINYFSQTRFYYAKFWEGGELIRDLVPYSGPRGVGLLDRVHDVLYTNAGGGTLTYGEE